MIRALVQTFFAVVAVALGILIATLVVSLIWQDGFNKGVEYSGQE